MNLSEMSGEAAYLIVARRRALSTLGKHMTWLFVCNDTAILAQGVKTCGKTHFAASPDNKE